jgi:anaerobic ribonucleoside-triphosphate reductase
MITIIKRDGRTTEFNQNKIIDAVLKAFKQVDDDISDYAYEKAGNIADYIQEYAENADHQLTVEEIQDLVENGLMSTKRKDVAKAYITYREERNRIREQKADWMQLIAEKVKASNVQNQNANVDEHSFGGRKGEADSVLMRKIALDYIVSDLSKRKHKNNEIYIHDLDSYAVGMHNCLTIPFDKLLKEGFNTRQMDIRPAGSISSAFQLVAVIFQLQSLQQFGGVSASHIDWTMVPYVRKSFTKHLKEGLKYIEHISDYKYERFIKWVNNVKDGTIHFDDKEFKNLYPDTWQYAMDITQKEVSQAVEGMYHNLNTLQSRSGN